MYEYICVRDDDVAGGIQVYNKRANYLIYFIILHTRTATLMKLQNANFILLFYEIFRSLDFRYIIIFGFFFHARIFN